MGKGANKQLMNNSGVGQAGQRQLYSEGQGVGNFITPQLENQAANPQGYTPQQQAYMNTAAQQSQGGSTAGVTGQANLEAARSRNAGGFQGAIGSGSRAAQRNLSQTAVGIQAQNANLQEQQREQAMQQLQSLYGTDIGSSLGYLNASTSALNAEEQASAAQNKNLQSGIMEAAKIAAAPSTGGASLVV